MKKICLYLSFFLSGAFFFSSCLEFDLDDIADALNEEARKSWEDCDASCWDIISGKYGDSLIVKWKVQHNKFHDSNTDGINPILLGDKLIVSSGHYTSKDYIYCIDLNTKEILWEWADYRGQTWGEKPHLLRRSRAHRNLILGDRLIWPTDMGVYAIDVNTGQLLAESFIEEMKVCKSGSHVDENLVIQTYYNDQKSWVEICDPSLNCRIAYAVEAAEGKVISINSPRLVVGGAGMDQNDSLLIMGIMFMDLESNYTTDSVKMISYNLSTRNVHWEYVVPDELLKNRTNLQRRYLPLVKDGLAYLQMFDHFICLDFSTGREVWRYNFQENGAGSGNISELFAEDGRLYFVQACGQLNALDARTGMRFWSNSNKTQVSGGEGAIDVYNDRLYMSNRRRIYAYDAIDGKGKRSYLSPNRIDLHDAYISHFTIDEERDVMYVDDGHYILACEIPGMW